MIVHKKVYIVRIWNDAASFDGEWENEAACLDLEDAKRLQGKLGRKTNVQMLKLVEFCGDCGEDLSVGHHDGCVREHRPL